MKYLLLLFVLFSCDTRHECMTITAFNNKTTIEYWEVSATDVDVYHNQIIYFTADVDGEEVRGVRITTCE